MQIQDIREDECVRDFLRSRRIRNSTKTQLTYQLHVYSSFLNKTPSEIIDEAEAEEDIGIKKRKRKIKKHILEFIEYLENERKVSEHTIQSYISTLSTFYDEHDITPPRIKVSKTNFNISYDKLPSLADVKLAVDTCKPRDSAIMLLMLSSGMGSSEIRNLRINDLMAAFNINDIKKLKKGIGTWSIQRYKTGMPYYTFNTKESTEALISYFRDREKRKTKIKSNTDFLFVSQRNEKISEAAFSKLFQRANDRAGLGYRDQKHRTLTSHILRKKFGTSLYKAGLDVLEVDWLLGHKISDSRAAYFKTNPDELKEKYKKVVEFITI